MTAVHLPFSYKLRKHILLNALMLFSSETVRRGDNMFVSSLHWVVLQQFDIMNMTTECCTFYSSTDSSSSLCLLEDHRL